MRSAASTSLADLPTSRDPRRRHRSALCRCRPRRLLARRSGCRARRRRRHVDRPRPGGDRDRLDDRHQPRPYAEAAFIASTGTGEVTVVDLDVAGYRRCGELIEPLRRLAARVRRRRRDRRCRTPRCQDRRHRRPTPLQRRAPRPRRRLHPRPRADLTSLVEPHNHAAAARSPCPIRPGSTPVAHDRNPAMTLDTAQLSTRWHHQQRHPSRPRQDRACDREFGRRSPARRAER